jgi:uncharacterized protein YfaS (alpha-2-macroglobulin family)
MRARTIALVACLGTLACGSEEASEQPEEIRGLFDRLEAPAVEEDAPPRLVLRDGPPVPEPGTVERPFPPRERAAREAPPPADPEPLRVLSAAPTGEDQLIGAVRVTFSQPMVPVAALSSLRARDVPIRIHPQPEGRFRWLGTSTLAFEPTSTNHRMPGATEYTVRVPAGTRSALGGVLAEDYVFRFATMPPRVVETMPYGYEHHVELRPIIGVRFDQRIDASAIAPRVRLVGGPSQIALVPIEPAELPALRARHTRLQGWEDDRFVLFRVEQALAKGTSYAITVPDGVRGAEGPRPMPEASITRFTTYPPLRYAGTHCGRDDCEPSGGIRVSFSSAITQDQDLAELITVEPDPGRLDRHVYDQNIYIQGDYEAQTTYRVRVRAGLRDIHGQTLREDAEGEIHTGDRDPHLELGAEQLATIELGSPHFFPVDVVNHAAIIARVAPVPRERLTDAIHAVQSGWGPWARPDPDPFQRIGARAATQRMRTSSPRNTEDRVGIPLGIPDDAAGYAMVELQLPAQGSPGYRTYALAQVTDLGLVATIDAFALTARVTSLSTGQPIEGARIRVGCAGAQPEGAATTGANGVARMRGEYGDQCTVVASKDDDESFVRVFANGYLLNNVAATIFTDRNPYRPGDTVHARVVTRERTRRADGRLRSWAEGAEVHCVVTDAHGVEQARFESELDAYGTAGDDFELPGDAATGGWTISCNVDGGGVRFGHSFAVEEYRAPEIEVNVQAPSGVRYVGGRPAFTIESRYLFGAPAAGMPVSWTVGRELTEYEPPGHDGFEFGDRTSWWLRGYHGLGLRGIGGASGRGYGGLGGFEMDQSEREIVASSQTPMTLDADGHLRLPVHLIAPADSAPAPYKFVLEAQVTDPSRQAVAGRTELIAHPASLYVGLQNERPFLTERDPIRVRAIATEVGGRIAVGKTIRIRAVERRQRFVHRQLPGGRYAFDWENDDREVGTCELTSASDPVECRIDPQRTGRYVIEARTTDEQGRENLTAISLYVAGNRFVPSAEAERVEVVPDRESYSAGDTARVLVRAPFANGRGLLTIEKLGAIETRAIDLDGNFHVVEVPITRDHVPQIQVRVALARGRASEAELRAMLEDAGPDALRAAQEDVGRPAYGTGMATLRVDPAPKTLTVEVTPEREVSEPGRPLTVGLRVRGANRRPVRAAVTVAVVDEGVLSLLGYETPDPEAALHPVLESTLGADAVHRVVVRRREMRQLRAMRRTQRTTVAERSVVAQSLNGGGLGLRGMGRGGGGTGEGTIGLGNLGTMGHGAGNGSGSGYGAGPPAADMAQAAPEAGDVAGAIPEAARGLFATTAFYRAQIETDAEGRAEVRFDLPDNLTTFRIMAIAVGTDDRSGHGEAQVRVRKRLLLRPALPRFATLGDRFDASVVVHNETGEEREVTVGVRAAGLTIDGEPFQRVRMRAGEAREVHFPARVDAAVGRGKVQFAASAGDAADAVEIELPFVEPATSEAFATYGSTEGGSAIRVPVEVPEGVIDRWGRLELTMSSTALTGLDDAADYLFEYPYPCAEQHASQLVAASALVQILEGRSEEGAIAARTRAREAMASLWRLQRGDGGFVYWPEAYDSELYTSAWVVYALLEAKRAGLEVDRAKLDRALDFLVQRVRYPSHQYGEDTDWTLQAAALYAYAGSDHNPPRDLVMRVHAHAEDLPLFAKAWLMIALRESFGTDDANAAELWRQTENAAVETAAGAHFAEQRVESARLLWHSERRTDAIVLAAMLEAVPDHPLVERTARALIAARRNGRWHTTQENAWALSALTRYYRARESVPPDLEVNAWLGDQFLGTTEMRGRSGAIFDGSIPMSALQGIGSGDLVVAPEGEGRVYYRIGLRYAPEDVTLPPEEQGFAVTRTYEAVEDEADVRRDGDGAWHVRAEATVRVRVTIVVPDDRYDVALDDPLPAGLEAVNMAFQTTATQRLSGMLDERRSDFGSWWAFFAFDHREMRDDRVVAFARHAPAGVYELTYLARATTPGSFVASPAHTEEMYAPEVFGRSASDRVVVERREARTE